MVLSFILFVLLTPGILLTLPPKGSKLTVAVVHGVVLAVLFCLAHKYFNSYFEEIFQNNEYKRKGI
jgi:uncharacterized BrkB/YihY/UPF0761 family membrane protein